MPAKPLPATGAAPEERRCDTADLIMIHRFIRAMFADAVPAVDRVQDGDRRQAELVAEHVRQVALVLHNHHHGEDMFIWDDLAERAPACALHVSQMRAQHVEVAELLTELDDALPPWSMSGTRHDAESVLEALARLNSTLDRHLGQEEAQILPVAAVNFTQPEWDRLAEHGRDTVPRDWAFMQIGFMLDSMPASDRDAFLQTLPGFIRMLWTGVGRGQYRRQRARLYGPETTSRTANLEQNGIR